MTKALARIRELETEIVSLAEYEGKLRRALDRKDLSVTEEVVARRQLRQASDSIDRAVSDIRAIDVNYIAPRIDMTGTAREPRRLVRWFAIETVLPAAAGGK